MTTDAILETYLGKRVKKNFHLSPYLTLRTETTAQFYFEATTAEDLIAAKKASLKAKLLLFLVGGGSNLAITQRLLKGLTVHNKYIEKKIIKNDKDSATILVSSGYPVTRLVKETTDEGFAGLEYHLGLPGTVGGALYMNSKWTHPLSYFGDILVFANLLDDHAKVKKVNRDYFHFAYDYSILHETKEIVLQAALVFKKTAPLLLQTKAKEAMEYRRKTQPLGVYTCGCFFRNISDDERNTIHAPTNSAGYLIDQAGLKGKTVGNFFVSDKHADFIINKGNGNPKDLVKLVNTVKDRVKQKFGITLKEEVIVI